MRFYESETVELKSEIVSDICKEVIAFANTQGGTLYIGVQNDGTVIGIDNAGAAQLRLNNMIRDSIKPNVTMFVHYETMMAEGKQILAVTVQKGTDRPYYLGSKGLKPSGVYVRNGTSTDPSTDTAIRKMIKETDGDSFEDMRSLEQNLTFRAAEAQFSKCKVAFDTSKQKTLGLMSADGVYSNVGLLLSDQCTTTIKAATFAGKDQSKFQDRREFTGSMFQQMEELYTYLDLRNQTRATFAGLYRTDTRDYPEEALREALMNSLVHRDYSYSASTLVSVYDDRIEFVSVGGLPNGISLDDIMLGLSVCRNPKLAAVFYRLKLIEAHSTGIPKIMKAYAGTCLEPKVEVTSNAFKITLPNRNAVVPATAPQGDEAKILAFLNDHDYVVRSDVVTYTLSDSPNLSMVTTMLMQAFEKIPNSTKLILHSDQGWHYRHKTYVAMLEEKGVRQSMSRKGNCYDNAVMENFFGHLKSELLYLQEFESMEHFKQELMEYIDYYNNRRIKAKLKGLPPALHRQQALLAA